MILKKFLESLNLMAARHAVQLCLVLIIRALRIPLNSDVLLDEGLRVRVGVQLIDLLSRSCSGFLVRLRLSHVFLSSNSTLTAHQAQSASLLADECVIVCVRGSANDVVERPGSVRQFRTRPLRPLRVPGRMTLVLPPHVSNQLRHSLLHEVYLSPIKRVLTL